jgi:hypothetical protein
MKEISLTQGKVALVDDEDFEYLSQWKWFANRKCHIWYAKKWYRNGSHKTTVSMHVILMNTHGGKEVDHIDGNGLNNQKNNLRICTHQENTRNARLYKNSTSGFKGVTFFRKNNCWRARIQVNGIGYHLGLFKSPIEAAKIYNKMATQYFGEFARLNVIREER